VLFGFEPRIISTRICKATYGVKTDSPFEEGTDPEDKKTIVRNIGDSENPPTIRIILVPSTFSSSNIV
jgi:hypothetical protein